MGGLASLAVYSNKDLKERNKILGSGGLRLWEGLIDEVVELCIDTMK